MINIFPYQHMCILCNLQGRYIQTCLHHWYTLHHSDMGCCHIHLHLGWKRKKKLQNMAKISILYIVTRIWMSMFSKNCCTTNTCALINIHGPLQSDPLIVKKLSLYLIRIQILLKIWNVRTHSMDTSDAPTYFQRNSVVLSDLSIKWLTDMWTWLIMRYSFLLGVSSINVYTFITSSSFPARITGTLKPLWKIFAFSINTWWISTIVNVYNCQTCKWEQYIICNSAITQHNNDANPTFWLIHVLDLCMAFKHMKSAPRCSHGSAWQTYWCNLQSKHVIYYTHWCSFDYLWTDEQNYTLCFA